MASSVTTAMCGGLERWPCAMPLWIALAKCSCTMFLCVSLVGCGAVLFWLYCFDWYGYGYKCKLQVWPLWLERKTVPEDCPEPDCALTTPCNARSQHWVDMKIKWSEVGLELQVCSYPRHSLYTIRALASASATCNVKPARSLKIRMLPTRSRIWSLTNLTMCHYMTPCWMGSLYGKIKSQWYNTRKVHRPFWLGWDIYINPHNASCS